jgi:hypothetical protein
MTELNPIERLTRDVRASSKLMDRTQARFLVDSYYQMQENRIRADGQIRSIEDQEPTAVLDWLSDQNSALENQIKGALKVYVEDQEIGKWALNICGIGPVIAAGLIAHIDIEKAPTVGHIWRFAGLDPTLSWQKGEKRPWNASLKVICWKAGESFVKVSNNENDIYGKIYAARKEYEAKRNEAGELADQAAAKLAKFKIGKTTEAYKAYSVGKLPPAHIHARAKRYAVKLFLSHFWEEWRRIEGLEIVAPYPIAHMGHVHKI